MESILWKFGGSGTESGQFNSPHRLAASNNELFVADLENYRIQVFDLDGNFLRQFETHSNSIKQFSKPIDVYAYDSQIFVVDQHHALILLILKLELSGVSPDWQDVSFPSWRSRVQIPHSAYLT